MYFSPQLTSRRVSIAARLAVILAALTAAPSVAGASPQCTDTKDSLFIGDIDELFVAGSVARLDAATGNFLDNFVLPGTGGLTTPAGLIFAKRGGPNGDLLVADQNALPPNTPLPLQTTGEVLRYDGINGDFLGALVPVAPPENEISPFAPRGIVLGKSQILYVADLGVVGNTERIGRIAMYDARTGDFLGDLENENLPGFDGIFRPRGIVIGPDDDLYVSVTNLPNPLGGYVLRFAQKTGEFLGVVVDSDTCGCDLNRPEGLVFGPDARLYLTSFKDLGDPTSVDQILIFELEDGEIVEPPDSLPLWIPPQPRAFAQALLFGPGGFLYVPISGGEAGNQAIGTVRRYDINTGTFDVFFANAGPEKPLQRPQYLTFGRTDPGTLAYRGPAKDCVP